MKMYIPEIGDKIVLTKDWTFRLFDEGRNTALFDLLKVKRRGVESIQRASDGKQFFYVWNDGCWLCGAWLADDGEEAKVNMYEVRQENRRNEISPQFKIIKDSGTEVTLKAGQVLSVDRVYIRRGASDFSSITFNYIGAPKGSGRVRFWAKLADVNTIEFEEV